MDRRRSLRRNLQHRLRLGHHGDRDVRYGLDPARDVRGVAGEDPAAVVVAGLQREALVRGIAPSRERPLRVPPRELPVVDPGPEPDGVAAVLGDGQAIVDGVRGPGRDEPDVGQRTRHPGVALVDGVAVVVEQEAAVEVRPALHRPLASVLHGAAVEDGAPAVVGGQELHPHVEGVHRPAGEEVADLPRPHHHLEAHRFAAGHGGGDPVERRHDLQRRLQDRGRGPEASGLLALRKGAGQPRSFPH